MSVTIVKKDVFRNGKLHQIDLYLDYYLPKQKRVRRKTGNYLRVGDSKTAQSHNKIVIGKVETLRASEDTKLNSTQSIALTTQKAVSSTVLEMIQAERKRLGKYTLYDNLQSNLTKFLAVSRLNDIQFTDLNFDFLQRYKDFMINDCKLSHSSAIAYLSRLNVITNKARILGVIQYNPMSGLMQYLGLKNDRKQFDYLTPSEIDSIRELKGNTPLLETTRLAFLFACYTGLRCNDVQDLKWNEIKDGHLFRKDIKTGKPNNLPLHDRAIELLNGLNNVTSSEGHVFTGLRTKTMSSNLKKLLKPLALNKHVTFHTARRSFAVNLQINNADITEIQAMLNHADTITTKLYTTIISTQKEKTIRKLSF